MRGDAAHSAHAREEKCYDPRSCPRPGVARLQGVRPRLTCRRCTAPARRAPTARRVLRKARRANRAKKSVTARHAKCARCMALAGARCVRRRVHCARCELRTASCRRAHSGASCAPGAILSQFYLYTSAHLAHLAPVCAPGACLRTWRLSVHLAPVCYMQNLREHDGTHGRAHLFVAMGVVPT